MARMVRKQIYIEPEQDEMLKRRAKQLGVTEAELIRRALNREAHETVPFAPDLQEAWQEAKRVMEARGRMVVPPTGRDWTREELYEDRFERYSR